MIRENNLSKVLINSALIFVTVLSMSFAVFAQQTTQYNVSVQYSTTLISKNDKFEFSLNGSERITIDWDHRNVNFRSKINNGGKYSVTQVSGTRTCTFWSQNQQGTIANQDVEIGINCGYPPTVNGTLTVSGIEQGETFIFANEYGNSYYATLNRTYPIQNFPIGDNYIFKQASGPRQCKMTNGEGIVPNTPLAIQANCGKGLTSGNPSGGNSTTPNPTPIPTTPNPTNPTTFPPIDLVSRSTDDKKFGTFYDSNSPDIGGTGADEGRYVTFVSYAAGLGNSTGKYRQIIWRDRKTGETRVISQGMNGAESDGNSFAPSISADGKSVAFESYATNLVPIDSNKVRDVFVWNYDRNTVTAVSDAPGGIEANSECFEPAISGDGRYIAFSSSASNLTPGVDGNSTVNLFLKDMQTGSVTLISIDPKTKKGGGGSRPSISEDGSRIAFYNYFPLTEDDKNTLWDIYVWQRGNPKLKRVSLTSDRMDRDQGTESSSRVITPTISGDGRFVNFATTAKNMFANDTNGLQDAFMVEIDSGRVTPLSFANGNFGDGDSPFGQGEKIPITFDGNKVVFTSKAANLGGSLIFGNLVEGSNLRAITPKKSSDGVEFSIGVPAISRNGKCVAFGSNIKLDTRFPSSGIFVVCQ